MKVIVSTIALGSWYPAGVVRIIQSFARLQPAEVGILPWVNCVPPGTPDLGEYTAYAARPFALRAALAAGADVAILIDASYWPIRPITPLIEHILDRGYYLQANGWTIGQWCSDDALTVFSELWNLTREDLLHIPDVAGGCVGLARRQSAIELLDRWCALAVERPQTIAGHRTNSVNHVSGRDLGFVSTDQRVLGHRPGQTLLGMLAEEAEMSIRVPRPKFCAYAFGEGEQKTAAPTDETVLVCHGMAASV